YLFSYSYSQDFNKWSIGLNVGAHDGIRYSGFGITRIAALHHFSINGRYMHSNRFGWRFSSGFDYFKWINQDNPTKYTRFNLEMVFNFTDVLHYDDFTKKFGLQAHVGFGYARMWNKIGIITNPNYPPLIENGPVDNMINGIIGLTPLFKLNEKINLNLDVAYMFHLRQDKTFDFRKNVPSIGGFLGSFFNLSLGATYYIGKKSQHADWVYSKNKMEDEIRVLNSQIAETKVGLEDNDRDGVINAIDEEPSTTLGSIVNNKGISDSIFNGSSPLTTDDIRNQLQATKNYIADDDGDGIINGIDQEKDTPEGATVNSRGMEIVSVLPAELIASTTDSTYNKEIEQLKIELNEIIKKLNDDDKDGVINAFDEETNTLQGAKVDNKGKTIVIQETQPVNENIDSDKDGVIDKFDLCPMLAGKAKGCPDEDGDEVPDILDACPSVKGDAKYNGCMDEQAKLINMFNDMSAYDVFFNTGSSTIEPTYKLILDKLAKLMLAEPTVKITAVGYADKNGSEEINTKLSKMRVENCVNYLKLKGISKDRFDISYKGSSDLIESIGVAETNAVNRRVKFSVKK
ncbi:MAG: hypothetical protein EBS86_12265, partial [Crocinitomicaceae bacterium]|nr:hypothetical protein [Crocinitomicaceae bacterium]